MARLKTNKTASKRVRVTNPKGNRKPKILYSKSAQHHLKTKLSRKSKRRKAGKAVATDNKKIIRIVKNLA